MLMRTIIYALGDHYPSSRLSSSQRPDVVPGNSIEEEATIFKESTTVTHSSPVIERESSNISPTVHQGENTTNANC